MSTPGSTARAAPAKRKRTDLTWQQKVAILDMNRDHPGTQVQLRERVKRELGIEIAAGTLSEMIKKEAGIREKATIAPDQSKRDRKAAFPELEDALVTWHKQVCARARAPLLRSLCDCSMIVHVSSSTSGLLKHVHARK